MGEHLNTNPESEVQEGEHSLQEIYDLREVTGFISGNDLHDFFSELVGEPSPSGSIKTTEEDLSKTETGQEILRLLNSPLKDHLRNIAQDIQNAAFSGRG